MNKGRNLRKKTMSNIILMMCSFLIGIGIVVQVKTTQKFTGASTTSQRIRTLQIELKNLKTKREEMEEEVAQIETEIEELRDESGVQYGIEGRLKSEIEEYETLVGYRKVNGSGVLLELRESYEKDSSILVSNYELILAVINKLNAAGARAISINEQRYVINTSIRAGEEKLYINEREIKLPIVIKAIGDQDTLEAAMNFRYGILWEMRNYYGIDAEVSKQDELEIPAYRGAIEYRFAVPVVKG